MDIFLSIIFSAIIYMIFPFAIFFKRTEKYSNKKIKFLLVCNSVIIKLLIITTEYEINHSINLAPAIIFFFVNEAIWCNKSKEKQKNNTLIQSPMEDKINVTTVDK